MRAATFLNPFTRTQTIYLERSVNGACHLPQTKSALLAPALPHEETQQRPPLLRLLTAARYLVCTLFHGVFSVLLGLFCRPADQLVHKAVLADHVAKEWVMKHREAYQKEQQQAAGQGEAPAAGGSGEGFVNPLAQNGTTDGPSEGAEEESPASV